MQRRERLSLSPQPFARWQQQPATPERTIRQPAMSQRSSLRQRVQYQRARAGAGASQLAAASGGQAVALRELEFTARWAIGQEPLDAAVLQYDFQGRFVQLLDARRSPLEWRDTAAWPPGGGPADAGEWRLTATHSGELVDASRGEARHNISVHLDDVCPNVQSLFFVVCVRDSTVGRAVSRRQVELRTLEHAGGSVDLPVLLPLGSAAAAAGSAVVCRVWRGSVTDGWTADRVGLPAPAVRGDEYDGLISAVTSWLSVQMSACDNSPEVAPRGRSPQRAIPAVVPVHAATGRADSRAIPAAVNRGLREDLERIIDEGAAARDQLEDEVTRLRTQLVQSTESQHAATKHVARLKTANHALQALVRTQRAEFEKAQKTAADTHEAELAVLNQRIRSMEAATKTRTVAAGVAVGLRFPTEAHGGLSSRSLAGPTARADRDETADVQDDRSQQVLLAELQALQVQHDAKCEELASCQSRLKSSNARVALAERELQEVRERTDSEAVDAVMRPCTEERVASLNTFLEEEKASKQEAEAERDILRGEKKLWSKERRKIVATHTKLREQIRALKVKLAKVRHQQYPTHLHRIQTTHPFPLLRAFRRKRSRWPLCAIKKLSGATSVTASNVTARSWQRNRRA